MNKIIVISIALLLNFINVTAQDSVYQNTPAQISLLYPIGTSGTNSSKQNLMFSTNLLVGITGEIYGFEVAGIGNINKGEVKGFQSAGVFNSTNRNFTGFRVAGLFNTTKKDLKGVQIAGLFNGVSNQSKGIQIAGLFNRTKILKGFQLAPINIIDSVDTGISFGLINIIRKGGYNELELSFSDYQNIGISFKHGTKTFYNIYNVGVNFMETNLWSAGIGFGHIQKISDKVNFQPEVITTNYFPLNFKDYKRTTTYKLKLGVVYNISDKIAISLAPNIYYADKEKGKNESYGYDFTSIKPFLRNDTNGKKSEFGLGFSFGLIFKNR
jgi:hypothetical protein